ncbi:MAG: pyridoxamine 5'-phosphate oxidase family protein [Nitrososphaerota archaeon]|nr:pyridoxamine 5'-phosphate oxidase family protein [Nitrososphaerota archaeon]
MNLAHRNLLNAARVARIGTVNRDGSVHMVPICFAFDGRRLFSTLRVGTHRLTNLDRKGPVSVLIDRYEEKPGEWTALQGVLLYCESAILNYDHDRKSFMEGWRLLVEKYPQYKRWAKADLKPTDPEKRRIIELLPTKVVSWGFD